MIFTLQSRSWHAGQACACGTAEPRRGRPLGASGFFTSVKCKNCALLRQVPILYSHFGVGNTQLKVCFGRGVFFNTVKVQSHHENATVAFLSVYLAPVSFPEGGRAMGYSTYQNLVGTKQRLYQVLRPLFVCLATRKRPAACVLWEEYGIPAFL